MRIEYIEKPYIESDQTTVGLKWQVNDDIYGIWKSKENDEIDFHYLISNAYWWSMVRKYWLVRMIARILD